MLPSPQPDNEIRHYGRIGGELQDLDKVIRKLHSKGSEFHFAYEAGPCGYQVYRHLTAKGYSCLVAPLEPSSSSAIRIIDSECPAQGCAAFRPFYLFHY
jgi:transposase